MQVWPSPRGMPTAVADICVGTCLEADHRGDAAPCPERAPEAIGFGALLQQRRKVGALLVGQPGRGTRWWPMAKRFRASVAGAFHPLTDGSFADAEGLGGIEPAFRRSQYLDRDRW